MKILHGIAWSYGNSIIILGNFWLMSLYSLHTYRLQSLISALRSTFQIFIFPSHTYEICCKQRLHTCFPATQA